MKLHNKVFGRPIWGLPFALLLFITMTTALIGCHSIKAVPPVQQMLDNAENTSKSDNTDNKGNTDYPKAVLLPADSRVLRNTLIPLSESPKEGELFVLPPFDKMANNEEVANSKQEIGMILPHHLVPIGALKSAYRQLQPYQPDLVVILSPNHADRPSTTIYIGRTGLEVVDPSGGLICKASFASEFSDLFPSYQVNDELLTEEHGISHQLALLDAQQWDTDILPLVLARNFSAGERRQLIQDIQEFIQNKNYKKILWIGSIDFSHYLPSKEAEKNDLQTISWISNRQFDEIQESTDAHIDAPAVLNLLMEKFPTMELLWHSNSAYEFNQGFEIPGTSYLIYFLSQ